VLIGWSAVTNGLTWAPVVLFGVIVLWTPPHFWALAIKYREDYAAADVPMLPVVASLRTTTRHIVAYTIVLWASTLSSRRSPTWGWFTRRAPPSSGRCSCGSASTWARSPSTGKAMRLFGFSITYLVCPLRRDGRRSVDPVGLLNSAAKCPHNSPLAAGA
jgi:protoheme IX farnesyltransferase